MDSNKTFFSIEENRKRYEEIIFSWLGTPYRHWCAVKGRGADCMMFLVATLEEFGLLDSGATKLKYYPRDWHINGNVEILLNSIEENKHKLKQGTLIKYGKIEISEMLWGDWLCFSLSPKNLCNHGGIMVSDGKVLHSVYKKGVTLSAVEKMYPYFKCAYRLCL